MRPMDDAAQPHRRSRRRSGNKQGLCQAFLSDAKVSQFGSIEYNYRAFLVDNGNNSDVTAWRYWSEWERKRVDLAQKSA